MAWTFYNASGEALVQHAESEATQAEMEAETAIAHFVPPDLVKNSPGVAKAWVYWNQSGTPARIGYYNVDSVGDDAVGLSTITFGTNFSGVTYTTVGNGSEGRLIGQAASSAAVGSVAVAIVVSDSGARSDDTQAGANFFGELVDE